MIIPEPKNAPFRSKRKIERFSLRTLKTPHSHRESIVNAYLQLLAAASISIAASGIVLSTLSGPLRSILGRICPDEQAAAFWLSYTRVMLMIAPLLLVLLVDLFSHFSNPLDSLRLALLAALGGLLIGLRSIGQRLGQFIEVPSPGSLP